MTITRHHAEIMALEYLEKFGPDKIGVIDDENKLCAVLLYEDMRKQGLVISEIEEGGPRYRITNKGRKMIADHDSEAIATGLMKKQADDGYPLIK